jgi:4-hydroxy-3-methylbut-2-enyl diphosphate reductase
MLPPFVKKAELYKETERRRLPGAYNRDKHHPEVQGLIGFAGSDAIIASDETLTKIKKKVGIIVQTTQSFETLKKIVLQVISTAREIKIYNTICDSTAQRVKETKELAKKVDLMIIVGGKNSANTNQLVKLSKEVCSKVYHIETAGEIAKNG